MSGFDWNGDGNHDHFDDYMDYRMSSGEDWSSGGGGGGTSYGGGCGRPLMLGILILLILF